MEMTGNRRPIPAAATTVFSLVLVAFVLATVAEAATAPVIAPGQEEMLAAMVGKGAQLPGDCKLTGGEVAYDTVKATYACPGGEVVLELTHPTKAGSGATRTERFALQVRSGSPPPGLPAAIETLIRAREGTFEWTMLEVKPEASSTTWASGAGATLVAVTILGWLVWRRRAAAATPKP